MLKEEILEENAGWRQCCQIIPNSLIRTSPVQVPEVGHGMVVDLSLEGLKVVLKREHIAGKKIPFPDAHAMKEF